MTDLAIGMHAIGALIALIYLIWRVGPHFSLTMIFLTALLLIHGPAYLAYVWWYGPDTFVYEKVLPPNNRDEVIFTLTSALAACFIGIILGAELAMRFWPNSAGWLTRTFRDEARLAPRVVASSDTVFMLTGVILIAVMAGVSLMENHIGKIIDFVTAPGSELDKAAIRREIGGSGLYAYNLLLNAVAPFIGIATYLGASHRQGRRLLGIALPLIAVIALGKLATLSKAPFALFLVQLILATSMVRSLRVNTLTVAGLTISMSALLVMVSLVAIPELDIISAGKYLFYRTLMIPNEVLVEYFATIPDVIPHGWGARFPLLSSLLPAPNDGIQMYTAVAEVSRGSTDSTSNAMFLGDAWAEFGWFGALLFPIIAGFVVRSVDIYAFRNGKTEVGIAIVSSATLGVFTLLSTSLTTALLSGGLMLVPLVAWMTSMSGSMIGKDATRHDLREPLR